MKKAAEKYGIEYYKKGRVLVWHDEFDNPKSTPTSGFSTAQWAALTAFTTTARRTHALRMAKCFFSATAPMTPSIPSPFPRALQPNTP